MNRRIGMYKLTRLARDESGAELVEFAMASLILMMLLFGVFEFAYAMYAYHFTTYASQQASRFAMVRGHTWSKNTATNCSTSFPGFTMPYDCTAQSSDIHNYVESLSPPGIDPGSITVNTDNWPGTTATGATTGCTANANNPGCLVNVTVGYSFNFIPFMRMTALSMSATSEKTILQ
ncbi:MAG: TadE/TadG family type IV pilus assembly protein [Terracidiphilus sp.]